MSKKIYCLAPNISQKIGKLFYWMTKLCDIFPGISKLFELDTRCLICGPHPFLIKFHVIVNLFKVVFSVQTPITEIFQIILKFCCQKSHNVIVTIESVD